MIFEGCDYAVYDATVLRKTEKALLCNIAGYDIWIPISQILLDSIIDGDSTVGDTGELVIPTWLAKTLFRPQP